MDFFSRMIAPIPIPPAAPAMLGSSEIMSGIAEPAEGVAGIAGVATADSPLMFGRLGNDWGPDVATCIIDVTSGTECPEKFRSVLHASRVVITELVVVSGAMDTIALRINELWDRYDLR